MTRRSSAAQWIRLSLIPIAITVTAGLSAQMLDQTSSNQTQADQTGLFGTQRQQSQYPPCTPADYGDPPAECIPANQRSPLPTYGPDDFTNISPSLTEPFNTGASSPTFPYPPQRQPRETSRDQSATYYAKEPPSEFQRYVATSTGVMLPIFGESLFERVPATFAPDDHIAVSPDYVIAPGDELQLTIWGQLNLSKRFVVDRTGAVILPDAGPVSVAGLNYSQASAVFKAALGRVYKNFDLNVTMGRLHSIQVFVVGDARRPGSYTVSSLSTLVNAIFASGGPSPRGSMRDIQLKRNGQTVCHFDLYDLLLRGDKSMDAQVASGDVILIPPAGRRVAIAGSVEHPAIYELKDGATLGDILRLADGLSPLAAAQEATLERVAGGAALEVHRIQLNQDGIATELHNGDIIRLFPVVPRFENAVTLRGNVADPGRFPWHAGMRLADLIPNKESLLTRDYWKERNRLAVDGYSGVGPELPVREDQRNASQLQSVDGQQNSTSRTELAMLRSPDNQVPRPTFREEQRNFQADSSLGAATSGDNVAPLRNFLPHNLVQPLAPEINWQYAVIERTDKDTLATRITPFRLGDLVLSHDPSQNLLLEPGDVVTIFSKADFSVPRAQQAKQVRVEGEIAMAGVYTLLPGETLRQVVTRAGGLTRNAYLYGAQFTRESTRREQQKRYDDFLAQLDREMTQSAANLSNRVISPQQAMTAQGSIASQHDLIDRLKKVPVDGRIVLDLEPNSRGVNALPDLPLENGDRLYVPSRPSTVNVIGTVFEQATFLYQEDLRVNDYLKEAGGPTRSADKSHMFVVRADGSVVSRSAAGTTLFAKNFDTLPVYPGDTLVVPTYINKTSFARNLMDWSQIFSNLALGAAAVSVLH
ncbi:MAG: SLBB domain-containing protein [Acidobacteriaceae bacterium]|nr:SLBB domain-containing protein [Acidobacteriaceae bacterium]